VQGAALLGDGVGGLTCQRVFAVSLPALIKERGGDARVVGMKPLTCPGRHGAANHVSDDGTAKGRV